jgi:hypothetical protein
MGESTNPQLRPCREPSSRECWTASAGYVRCLASGRSLRRGGWGLPGRNCALHKGLQSAQWFWMTMNRVSTSWEGTNSHMKTGEMMVGRLSGREYSPFIPSDWARPG